MNWKKLLNTFNFFCTRCGILNVLRKVIYLVNIRAIFLVLNLVNSDEVLFFRYGFSER